MREARRAGPALVGPALVGLIGLTSLLTLTACGGSPDETPLTATTCAGLPDSAALLASLNTLRAQGRTCGGTAYPAAAALIWDERLALAAQRHSRDMAGRDHFSHTGTDGSTSAQRSAAAGYTSPVAENIAAGSATLGGTLAQWLASSAHCSSLMSADYRDTGLACASAAGSTYGHYWTLVLGTGR